MNRILRSQLPPNPRDLAVFDTTTGSSPGRTRWKMLFLATMMLFVASLGQTQISLYSFTQSTGTYADITGGTVLITASSNTFGNAGFPDDQVYNAVPIGFSFTCNGLSYTAVNVSANGYITLGATAPVGNNYSPISGTAAAAAVFSVWGGDGSGMFNVGGKTSSISYVTTGVAPNRIFTIEYRDYRPAYSTSTTLAPFVNYQIQLFETTNIIRYMYGPSGLAAGTANSNTTRQIGLRGSVNTDFRNRTNSTAVSFNSSTAGTVNTNTQAFSSVNATPGRPTNGLIYEWTPPPPCEGQPNAAVATFTGGSSICAGQTKAMSATGISTGTGISLQWAVSSTPGGPYTNVSGGVGATTASYTSPSLTAGTYYYVLQTTCSNSALVTASNELVLTVNALPTIVVNAANGGAFCGVQSLSASGASTYSWSPASSLSASTGSTVSFTGTASATITATGTDANGCVGTAAQAITYSAPAVISLVSSVPNFCGAGGTTTISATSSAPYTYVFEALDGATLSNTTASTVDATISGTSAIRVTGNDAASGCAAQAIQSVGLYPLPSATVTTTASGVCPGTPATINSGLSAGNFSAVCIPVAPLAIPATAAYLANNGTMSVALASGNGDDGGWSTIPLGFNFNFFGTSYSTINVGTNGVLQFGTYNAAALGDYTIGSLPNTVDPLGAIYICANDLNTSTAGTPNTYVRYWTEGYAPNRKFVIEYRVFQYFSTTNIVNVQAILYETLGMVDIVAKEITSTNSKSIGVNSPTGTVGATAPNCAVTPNASSYWSGQTATISAASPQAWRFSPPDNYLTTWSATDVNGTTALTTNVDGSTINVINGFSATVSPSQTTTYSISYANATTGCSNALSPAQVEMVVLGNIAPTGVTATSTVTTACPGANIPLATDYTGITDGLTYQWQVSTDGGNSWNDIVGANAATYTATQTQASSYRVGIASCGGSVEYTSSVAIALTDFIACYCNTISAGGTGTLINEVSVNNTFINNSSASNPVASPYYTNYNSLPANPAVILGVVMNLSLTMEPTGTYAQSIISVWIDFNHNGIYEASEWTQFGTNVESGATTTVGIPIPSTALTGNTGMRIRTRGAGNTNGAGSACSTDFGSGETEDYILNILGPCDPALFTPPLASADDADATVCGTQTSQLTAFDFNGVASPIYLWYDAPVGGNLLQNSASNFYTPAAITATTTWYVATNTGTCITDRFPVTLNWVAPAAVTVTNSNPSSCGTTSTATDLAASSSNSGYTYTWNATPVAGSGITAGTTGASIAAVTPTVNGVYTYTANAVDAATGCTTSATTTVGFYSPLTGTATVTQPLVCGGNGSVNFSVTGSGTVFASDFSSATLNPAQAELCNNAVITGGQLQFTAPVNNQKGGILITNTTGIASNDFQIDFDMITTAGTNPPADGFSYSYGPDVVCMPTPVGTDDNVIVGAGAANPENGSGSGIRLSFDAYTNGVNVNGIYLMYNCLRKNPSSTLTPAEGLYYFDANTSWIGGANTHVTITINALGQMSMWLAGTQVLNNAQLPADYLTADKSTWKHAFAARTGGLNQGHLIDNLDIHYNNFYEYSVDNGATWTTTSPVAAPAPSSVHNLARYTTQPACSVDLGTATVEYQVAAPTAVTGGSTCLNGTTLNVSAFGLPIPGQTATYSFGSNLPSGVGTSNGIAGIAPSIQGSPITISLPAGAIVTGAQLVLTNVTSDYMGELQVALSGAATLGTTQVFTNFPASGATGTITLAAGSITNGTVNVLLGESYDDAGTDATAADISLNLTYSLPSDPSWFDNTVASAGSFVGTAASLNVVGTTILPSTASSTTATAYAANVVTNGASTCYSATVPATVTVGQPLTVSIAATAPSTQVTTLNTGQLYIIDGASEVVTSTVTIPVGATVISTQLIINGVTSIGTWGTDGTDVNISMSGASTVTSQALTTSFNLLDASGPYTFAATPITSGGGTVFVNITNNNGWGDDITIDQVQLIVTYSAPVTGSVCPGTPVTLTAATTGGGSNPTYQWNLNGTPIAGATSASYVATPASATDAYTATVVDDCNPSGITSSGFSVNLFTVTAGTITGPAAILVNDFTAPIPGAGTWNIAGQNSGSTIQWSYGTVSTGPYTAIAGGTNADQTLFATGAGGSVYLTATTTTTDGCSIQANVVEVVLGNTIDTPCTAAAITLGNQSGIEWSNAAASAQTGETYGNGITNPGNTVWFSFVAPASGHVSIETTSSTSWDNYITLFSGSDCTNPAGLTQIGFNDDANGTSQAALMNVTCLTPGITYYIQMRGYANSIGQGGIILTDLGNTAPVVSGISSNITASAATGTCAATVTWTAPTTSDDQSCAVTLTSNYNSGASFPVGVTTVTYTATDVQGLATTASFTVTVNDTQLPTITAPGTVTVTAALNACTATATLGSATTADNCGVATTTNNAPAAFPVGTTTVVWTVTDVNGNVATANQIVTVVPDPTNLWYADTDNDGFGNLLSTTVACAQPIGYVLNTTDCNDSDININPGEAEVCGNSIDDNCSGTQDEGCDIVGENPGNALPMITSFWPNCSAVNGTLSGATVSSSAQTLCLTGEDKWYSFYATSEAVSIVVNSSSNDVVIELQTYSGTLLSQENAVSGLGSEILNFNGLVAGQEYKVGVRNYNSALGAGAYSICVKMLKRGGCAYGPGPYSLCQYFKATYAGGTGVTYTYTYTGLTGPAAGNTYTRVQNSDICVLSSVVPTMPYGSTYSVLISNTYTINNGAGVPETITVPALSACSMGTITQPSTALRASDRCTAGPKFRGSIVASLPWVCGATNWRWEFTEINPITGVAVGIPFAVNRNAASNFLNLGTVLGLQYGKTYSVRTAPIMPYTGTNYQWGTPFCMSIVGTAGMVADGSQANNQTVRVETANEVNMSLYPNPTHGTDVNINLSGIDSENVQIRIVDAMGRQVWNNRYSVSGVLNTNITFERPLANGLYMVEAIFNGEVQTQRMMVQK